MPILTMLTLVMFRSSMVAKYLVLWFISCLVVHMDKSPLDLFVSLHL